MHKERCIDRARHVQRYRQTNGVTKTTPIEADTWRHMMTEGHRETQTQIKRERETCNERE
jgi:hypothetical protein